MGGGRGGSRFNKQKKGRPRDNRKQNEQFNAIAKKFNLTPKQRRMLHDYLNSWDKQTGFQEIFEAALELFGDIFR